MSPGMRCTGFMGVKLRAHVAYCVCAGLTELLVYGHQQRRDVFTLKYSRV